VENAAALTDGLLRRGATLVTDGTDNHLVLMDVSGYELTGRQAESALVDSGIVTNRNAIPASPNGAWYTFGIRLGTPALTTRGLGPAEMDVAALIDTILASTRPAATADGAPSKARYSRDASVAAEIAGQAAELLARYPSAGRRLLLPRPGGGRAADYKAVSRCSAQVRAVRAIVLAQGLLLCCSISFHMRTLARANRSTCAGWAVA
jgi:hypothetical protein